jgi:hypothetical protein
MCYLVPEVLTAELPGSRTLPYDLLAVDSLAHQLALKHATVIAVSLDERHLIFIDDCI